MKINKILSLIMFIILVMSFVSCKSELEIIKARGIENYGISIILAAEYAHESDGTLYPGEKAFINYRRSDNQGTIDETKTIVWTFIESSNGDNVMDSEVKEAWNPTLVKVFNEEGTYIIRADLYDSEQYKTASVDAPLLGTDKREIVVEAIDFEIEQEVIEENIRQFKPRILNPEIGPVYTGLRVDFGDNTLEIFNEKLPDSITHTYETEGTYNVTAELLYKSEYNESVIAKSERPVRVRGELDIVAPPGPLKTDTGHTFQAQQVTELTSNPKYRWNFGDGKVSKILPTDEVTHSYILPGSYVIHADLIDGDVRAVTVLASTDLTIEIEESGYFLSELQQMKRFDFVFAVQHDYTDHTSGVFKWDCGSGGRLVWDGTNFSLDWSRDNHSEHVTGRVSEDGAIIEHMMIRHEFFDFNRTTQWYELVIHNLPLLLGEAPYRFTIDKQGEELSEFVTFFGTYRTEGYSWTEDANLRIKFEK